MTNSALPPILFEDDSFIAFDKPSGLLVSPDRWDKERENLAHLIHTHLSPQFFTSIALTVTRAACSSSRKRRRRWMPRATCSSRARCRSSTSAITHGLPKEEKGTIRMAIAEDKERPGK